MKSIILLSIIYFLLLLSTASNASRYQFLFHNYNDISSYSHYFSLPYLEKKGLFYGVDGLLDASNNRTLGKNEEDLSINFQLGMKPLHCLKFEIQEKASNNSMETEEIGTGVVKNELLFNTTYIPRDWLKFTPYILKIDDSYRRNTQENLDIDNDGTGKGIKGFLNVKNIGNITSEIGFVDQSISNEKKAILDAGFEKTFSRVRIVGYIEGSNIVTQYPILNGREEKFLESSRGNLFSEFSLFDRVMTHIGYEGSYRNEIYTLLEGYGGKQNDEEMNFNNFTSNLSYPLNSRTLIEVKMARYNRERNYQEGLNDEVSTIKSLTPSLTFRPIKGCEIKLERILRLSSFNFPNPIAVTDRDILDKSDLLTAMYNLPGGTAFVMSFGRIENHIIYIGSEMSANNVQRTKYSLESNINYLMPQRIEIKESFSLTANYQIYDFSSERNLFARAFTHCSALSFVNLDRIQPSIEYRTINQNWGPYLFSYEEGNYLFYRNIENKKESYKIALALKPFDYLTLNPSYLLAKNRLKNLGEASTSLNSAFTEEHYSMGLIYKKVEGKLIDLGIIWIKRNEGSNFYEIKTNIFFTI